MIISCLIDLCVLKLSNVLVSIVATTFFYVSRIMLKYSKYIGSYALHVLHVQTIVFLYDFIKHESVTSRYFIMRFKDQLLRLELKKIVE